jgi:hypothetical protein
VLLDVLLEFVGQVFEVVLSVDEFSVAEPDVVVVLSNIFCDLIRNVIISKMLINIIHLRRKDIMPLIHILDQRGHGPKDRSRNCLTSHHCDNNENSFK